MYQSHKTYVEPWMKMSVLLSDNPYLLLFLEHLGVDFVVKDKTVKQICSEYGTDVNAFLNIANLYNGFYPTARELESIKDITVIIKFLKNSHTYYKNDKYPEINNFIRQLKESHSTIDINLIEKFFNDYFTEVLDHLDYEDDIAFPYFCSLNSADEKYAGSDFSVNEFREHHTDIETKLTDLKNLLLKHISIENELPLRRKFLISLFELEYDLNIHTLIEEMILIPVVEKMEKKK